MPQKNGKYHNVTSLENITIYGKKEFNRKQQQQ